MQCKKLTKVEIKLIVTDIRVCFGPRQITIVRGPGEKKPPLFFKEKNTIIVSQCFYNNRTITIIQKPKRTELMKEQVKKRLEIKTSFWVKSRLN